MLKLIKIIQTLLSLTFLLELGVSSKCSKKHLFFSNYINGKSKKQIGELLGEGSHGEVFLIDWRGINGKEEAKPAVLKIAKGKSMTDFENEASKNAEIYSEKGVNQVPKLFGCFVDQESRYHLVMEFIPHPLQPVVLDSKTKKEMINLDYLLFA